MGDRTCSTDGCDRKTIARGLCPSCYNRRKRLGDLPPVVQFRTPPGATEKRCTGCHETKPIDEFSLARNGTAQTKPVRKSKCKACQAAAAREWFHQNKERAKDNRHRWSLGSLYGMTGEQYAELLDSQGGVCAICGKDEPNEHGRTGTKFRLSVDHCHSTGRVRGLLCQKCNRAIGLLGDDPELIQRAIEYLMRGTS